MRLEVDRMQNAEPFLVHLSNKLGKPLLHLDTDKEGSLSAWHLSELWSISCFSEAHQTIGVCTAFKGCQGNKQEQCLSDF